MKKIIFLAFAMVFSNAIMANHIELKENVNYLTKIESSKIEEEDDFTTICTGTITVNGKTKLVKFRDDMNRSCEELQDIFNKHFGR